MSQFREIVENCLAEHGYNLVESKVLETKDIKLEPRTEKQLLKIFCLDENELSEDKDENKNTLWLARNIYEKFIQKVKEGKYERTKFGGIVNINDLEIEFSITGKAGDGVYTKLNNKILVYTEKLNDLENDLNLRNGLIHEIVHSISYDDFNNFNNYISPETNKNEYLTQPLEFEANKIALCDYLVDQILKNLKQQMLTKDIDDSNKLQNYIDQILYNIMSNEKHTYYDFLSILHKKKKLNDFYSEIVETCIEYIQDHLAESTLYSVGNDFKQYLIESKS